MVKNIWIGALSYFQIEQLTMNKALHTNTRHRGQTEQIEVIRHNEDRERNMVDVMLQ